MISAVVILYYPNDSINGNIRSYLPFVDRLYIIDNSEQTQLSILNNDIHSHPAVLYYHDGQNGGIAERLNFACLQALSEKNSLLLTMDQDSYFEPGHLSAYLEQVITFTDFSSVGMFGVKFDKMDTINYRHDSFEYVTHLITSGSIINLTNFKKAGNFNEDLFIDQVDFEFCLRVIKTHLKVICFTGLYIQHQLGKVESHLSLKNFQRTFRSLHSPIRMYYMVRNYFYVCCVYKADFPVELKELKKDIIVRIKNNLPYGKHRTKLLWYLGKALLDYRNGKMGKI